MSNLYRLEVTMAALARQFDVEPVLEPRVPSPARPGDQGLPVGAPAHRHAGFAYFPGSFLIAGRPFRTAA